MSETYWVFDPGEGKEIPLNVRVNKWGRIEIKRLPAHNFSGGETARLLEKKAAFVDIASGTFGERWTEEGVPVWSALKRRMPEESRRFNTPRQSQREAKQARYQELLGPEVLRTAVTTDLLRRRGRSSAISESGLSRQSSPDLVQELLRNPRLPARFPWPPAERVELWSRTRKR